MPRSRRLRRYGVNGGFYDAPSDGLVGAPGELLKAEPMTARWLPGISMAVDAWRVLYRSTSASGAPNVVTGVVLVPRASAGDGPVPLLGFAPGTQGLSRRAALSRQLALGIEYEAPFLAAALRRGWTVAVTDYPGLGTRGAHPYVVGRSLGPAVLDVMRAARQLPAARLTETGPVGIYGYSEGGCAAGWAAQLQPAYAPDIALDAVAVGAAPSDLPGLVDRHERSSFSFLLMYAALGFDQAYPQLQLHRYLNRGGRLTVAVMRRTHIVAAIVIGLLLPKHRRHYLIADPLTEPEWLRLLAENSLGDLAPSAPVLVGTARHDQVIPYRQLETLIEKWRRLGVDVRQHPIPFGEHLIGGPKFCRAAFAFLGARFAEHQPVSVEPTAS